MKTVGICAICSRPSKTLYTCFKCLRKVCSMHYTEGRLCTECAAKPEHAGKPAAGPQSELVVPESAKPTEVKPTDVKH